MTSLAHFEKVAGVIELPHQAVVDGHLQPAASGRTFDNVTPRNGTVINPTVPDVGSTFGLLGLALAGLTVARRKLVG